jgi:HEAT repeat protein
MRLLSIALLALASQATPAFGSTDTEKAWNVLKEGCADKNPIHRAQAVQALGLVPGVPEAETLAVSVLFDSEAKVRAAAAAALGQMKAKGAAVELKKALGDPVGEVVIAAADALVQISDPAGFEVDFEVLMRRRKTGTSLKEQEHEFLHNPKEMEKMGFEEGVGFIPFGSMSLTAFRMVTKDSLTPERAKAARALAKDPDPQSGQALVKSLDDEKWLVRTACAAAIAERNDPTLLKAVVDAMEDKSEIVSYTAAAAVVHLTNLPARPAVRRRVRPLQH